MSDIVERLNEGCVYRRARYSGDTLDDLGGPIDEEATDARMKDGADEITRLRTELAEVRAENERLDSWAGIMSLLEKHYPSDVFTGVSGDPGAVTVVALREIDTLRQQLAVAREGLEEISDDWGDGGPSIAASTLAKLDQMETP